jgi:hypothetical protein
LFRDKNENLEGEKESGKIKFLLVVQKKGAYFRCLIFYLGWVTNGARVGSLHHSLLLSKMVFLTISTYYMVLTWTYHH